MNVKIRTWSLTFFLNFYVNVFYIYGKCEYQLNNYGAAFSDRPSSTHQTESTKPKTGGYPVISPQLQLAPINSPHTK